MTFARSAAARKAGHAIRQISTRRFRDVAKGIAELPNDTVIDGEIVALDENGRPSFNLLQGFGSCRGHSPLCLRSAHAAGQGCPVVASR
jgi:hypothetical protein